MAVISGTGTEGRSFYVVAQQIHHRAADCLRISPRHQYPAPIGEEFPGIKIRRGNNRLTRADRVGQSPGGALFRFEVRRDIDVGGREKLDEFAAADETVVKDHARRHAEFLGPTL